MKKELENKLFEKYPIIFKERNLSPELSCFAWGITCGDGWFNIIDNLCHIIDEYNKTTNLPVIATQVKSKFGQLRFYVNKQANEEVLTAIKMAEVLSTYICEKTGKLL